MLWYTVNVVDVRCCQLTWCHSASAAASITWARLGTHVVFHNLPFVLALLLWLQQRVAAWRAGWMLLGPQLVVVMPRGTRDLLLLGLRLLLVASHRAAQAMKTGGGAAGGVRMTAEAGRTIMKQHR